MADPAGPATAARVQGGGLPPAWRVPLLLLGFFSLLIGTTAGLARLGWAMPELSVAAAGVHGPLMICGFFGVVISLERAVAMGRAWAYLAPLCSGAGALGVVIGRIGPGAALFLAGSLVLLAASLDIWRRQRALFTLTMALAAACWAAGNALWLAGWPVHQVVPWWLAFLVLTIAGERLELSRFLPPSPRATQVFALVLLLALTGLLGVRSAWGVPLFGASLLALALWLLKQDVARRTVRMRGLTRYIATCLLAGYVWLALGSLVMLQAGMLLPGSAAYDASLHAIGLGFVFSMVFGHAPIIFPAVLRVAVPYLRVFYAPLLLLHVSVALRLAGDAGAVFEWRHAAGMLNALALLGFIGVTAAAVWRGRRAKARAAALPRRTDRIRGGGG